MLRHSLGDSQINQRKKEYAIRDIQDRPSRRENPVGRVEGRFYKSLAYQVGIFGMVTRLPNTAAATTGAIATTAWNRVVVLSDETPPK